MALCSGRPRVPSSCTTETSLGLSVLLTSSMVPNRPGKGGKGQLWEMATEWGGWVSPSSGARGRPPWDSTCRDPCSIDAVLSQ
jgi:hypothetical protein